ncbi:hypothetical protein ACOPJQ_03510 [Luteimonas dalianensis]|uniref:hypothetical protein n=1 Tax=Luteimonas dalianensis TaxID=1148196 RepID=UPI003D6B3925
MPPSPGNGASGRACTWSKPAIGVALDEHAPQPGDAWADQLGSLTRARAIGVLAVLALAAPRSVKDS